MSSSSLNLFPFYEWCEGGSRKLRDTLCSAYGRFPPPIFWLILYFTIRTEEFCTYVCTYVFEAPVDRVCACRKILNMHQKPSVREILPYVWKFWPSKVTVLENSSVHTEVLGVFDKTSVCTEVFGWFWHKKSTQKTGGFANSMFRIWCFFAGKPKKQGIFGGVSLNFLELP